MKTNEIKRMLTIDDGQEILSKYLSIFNDEADRINALPVDQRTASDIKVAISAATFLVTMNKADAQEVLKVRAEVKGKLGGDYNLMPKGMITDVLNTKVKGMG